MDKATNPNYKYFNRLTFKDYIKNWPEDSGEIKKIKSDYPQISGDIASLYEKN